MSQQINPAKTALELIAEERQRQIDVYGYTDEHIASHSEDYADGELADAAACYAANAMSREYGIHAAPIIFPWHDQYWKPSLLDRTKELVKAGAMIVAEIERIKKLKNGN